MNVPEYAPALVVFVTENEPPTLKDDVPWEPSFGDVPAVCVVATVIVEPELFI